MDKKSAVEPEEEPIESGATPQHRSLVSQFRFFLKHLWIVGLCLLAGLLLAIGYILTSIPLYRSTIVLQVAQQQQRVYDVAGSSNNEDNLKGDDILNTITQTLKLQSVYDRVANDPSILEDPDIVPSAEAAKDPSVRGRLVGQLMENTAVSLQHGTRLIFVSVDYPVPEAAQKLATTIVNQFIAAGSESDISTSHARTQFLLEDVGRTKISLQKAEDGLQIYREALRQKQRVDDQQKVVDALSQRYLDAHPKMIEARSLLSDLERGVDAEIKKIIASSPTEATYWAQSQSTLTSPTPDDIFSSELKMVEARANVFQREVDTESALFESLLKQMRDADVKTESAPVEVHVVNAAHVSRVPVKPNKPLVLIVGILGGLVSGIGIVFLLQNLDSSLHTAEELEQVTGLPVLGTIPLLSARTALGRSRRKSTTTHEIPPDDQRYQDILLISDPAGIAAENIRSFRAALDLIGKEEDHRTTLFSSALPSEGKTFTSCNFAVSLAQRGARTLLIDADLRRPGVHTRFHLENNRPGLTEHVALGMDLEQTVHANVIENLDLMLAGGRCPNPAEFLGGTGFAETIDGALLKYDRIVVDSPPINLVSDTRLIAPFVHTVCLVVKAQSTSRHAVRRALSLLEMAQVRPAGIVFNCVPKWSVDEYYGYQSGQYKYGEAYGEKR